MLYWHCTIAWNRLLQYTCMSWLMVRNTKTKTPHTQLGRNHGNACFCAYIPLDYCQTQSWHNCSPSLAPYKGMEVWQTSYKGEHFCRRAFRGSSKTQTNISPTTDQAAYFLLLELCSILQIQNLNALVYIVYCDFPKSQCVQICVLFALETLTISVWCNPHYSNFTMFSNALMHIY